MGTVHVVGVGERRREGTGWGSSSPQQALTSRSSAQGALTFLPGTELVVTVESHCQRKGMLLYFLFGKTLYQNPARR